MLRKIGRTGIEVYAIGLGAMPLSLDGRPPEEDAIKVLHAAFDAGMNFIDTADAYCIDDRDTGHNERLIAKALASWPNRDKIIVATKGGCLRPRGDWEVDSSPEHLREACEKSLKNLGVESITLYQLHGVDRGVPFEDSVNALAQLKEEGKIQHIGLSNITPAQFQAAQRITRIESVQNRCNPFEQQSIDSGLMEFCAKQATTFISHSPVGGYFTHRKAAINPLLKDLGVKYSCSSYCIMLAWHLALGEHVIPIPGASKISSVLDSVKAVQIRLSGDDLGRIDKLGNQ